MALDANIHMQQCPLHPQESYAVDQPYGGGHTTYLSS
jgi:hypothetical protein